MMTEFEMIAKTFQGLEEILAKELIELGANEVAIGNRMVSFKGDKLLLYKANFHLRTAIRILKPFLHFKAGSADDVYNICKKVNWEEYMSLSSSFAVDAVVYSEDFKHSKFVAYRVKDAIADYFREKYGKRPNVSVANPDLTFHIHISHDHCSLSLDSSGESLHKRGYRQEAMEAPLNEVLAAGMILLSGWNGQSDFIDPMCGSGTIPIEAALIAHNMAPGLFRSQYAFEKWKDFDKDMFPVNLEILSASKRIDVEKEFLTNPDGDVKIVIESDLIQLEVCFKNNDEEYVLKYCNRHEDNLKIENLKTTFALV